MKRISILVLITLMAVSVMGMGKKVDKSPAVGEAAPDFIGEDILGNDVQLSDYKGKVVVLEWTNHLCPFVKRHYDTKNMQALQLEMTGRGIKWISVISSGIAKQGYLSAEGANKIVSKQNSFATHVVLDPSGKIGKAYGAKTTPHMYIVNKKGVLVYKGAIDDLPSASREDTISANNYVRQAVNELMQNLPISVSETTPYGCSVKYN